MTVRIAWIVMLWAMCLVAIAQQASVIKEIVITGNQRVTRAAILAAMRTKVGQPYVQDNLDQDKNALEDLGFFSAVDIRPTSLEGGDWRITVNVQENPVIKEIRVSGNTVVKTEDILKVLTLKPGDVYNFNQVRPSAEAVRNLYTKKGYFAQVEEFAPMKDSPNTINLSIIELRVGTVGFQGNKRTKDWVMQRLIKIRPGDVFSIQKWSNDLRRIYNTQWFDSVKSIENDQREVGKVDLTADVKETRTGLFNVGVQLDPRSLLAGVLSLRESNLGGTGKTVGINFLQSTVGQGPSLDLDYTNPFYDSRDTALNAAIYSRLIYRFSSNFLGTSSSTPTTESQYTERRTGGSLGFNRPVGDYLNLGISGRFENIKTSGLNSSTDPATDPTITNFIQQDGDVGVLTFGGTLNRRDVDLDPSRGDWLQIRFEPGYSNVTSSLLKSNGVVIAQGATGANLFGRVTAEYRRYFSPGPPRGTDLEAPRRVFAFRLRYGGITGDVPFFEQFFAGGAETIRGYAEDRFWGKQMLLSTVEYRHPIQKAFNLIGFVDYGGAWGGYPSVGDFGQSDKLNLHLGYGVGLSFRTPLGPIRLDLGFDENGKSRTHFLIGNSF